MAEARRAQGRPSCPLKAAASALAAELRSELRLRTDIGHPLKCMVTANSHGQVAERRAVKREFADDEFDGDVQPEGRRPRKLWRPSVSVRCDWSSASLFWPHSDRQIGELFECSGVAKRAAAAGYTAKSEDHVLSKLPGFSSDDESATPCTRLQHVTRRRLRKIASPVILPVKKKRQWRTSILQRSRCKPIDAKLQPSRGPIQSILHNGPRSARMWSPVVPLALGRAQLVQIPGGMVLCQIGQLQQFAQDMLRISWLVQALLSAGGDRNDSDSFLPGFRMSTRTGLSRGSQVSPGAQDVTVYLAHCGMAGVLAQLGSMAAPAAPTWVLPPQRFLAMLGRHVQLAALHTRHTPTIAIGNGGSGHGQLSSCAAHLTTLLGGSVAAARPLACACRCSALTLLRDSLTMQFSAGLRPLTHALTCSAARANQEEAATSTTMPMLLENDQTRYAAIQFEANLDHARVLRVVQKLAELASQAWSLSRKIGAARARRARASIMRFW